MMKEINGDEFDPNLQEPYNQINNPARKLLEAANKEIFTH